MRWPSSLRMPRQTRSRRRASGTYVDRALVSCNPSPYACADTTLVTVLRTKTDTRDDAAERNRQKHQSLVAELREPLAKARLGGPEPPRERHTKAGKLLPRERVER